MLLEGIRVVDVGSYVAAPVAATVMADFGADVVKVEPLTGDPYRRLLSAPMRAAFPNFFWDQDSRNKRSLAIDLTTAAGRAVIERLIGRADVVITNYRPDLLARLELDYDTVRTIREDVIYAQVSSYGLKGADANRTGFDTTAYWARTALMDMVRRPGAPHAVSVPGMGDHPTGMALFGGIMAALYRRERTGEGAHVHTSLTANGAWSNSMMIQGGLVGFDGTELRSPDDFKRTPLATTYETMDERLLLLSILNPVKEWPGLLRALGRREWADDPRFGDPEARVQHAMELYEAMAEIFRSDRAESWCARLDGEQITYSVAQTMAEVINDPQMYENDIITPVPPGKQLYAHTVNSPIWIADETKSAPVAAPEIGEHTVEILAELGLSETEIGALIDDGVAAQHEGQS